MNPIKQVSRGLIVLALVVLSAKSLSAQTSGKPSARNIEEEYAAGVQALNDGNWPRAIVTLENVVKMKRNYRDARAKLEKAKRYLESESLNAVLDEYYAQGLAALAKNDLQAAQAAWRKIHQSNPRYRDIASRVTRIEERLQKNSETAVIQVTLTAPNALLDSLYRDGKSAAESADWVKAIASFEKLKLLQPNYRDVAGELARAWEKLDQAKTAEASLAASKPEQSHSYVGVALLAVVVLLTAGVIGLSPLARARFHLWRGNDKAAVQIYERLLAKNPRRVKLYVSLANVYLRLGSADYSAMKAYRVVLQLNLSTHHREKITSIVAQKFLTEGRTDTDAIEVLENALKAELQKQNLLA